MSLRFSFFILRSLATLVAIFEFLTYFFVNLKKTLKKTHKYSVKKKVSYVFIQLHIPHVICPTMDYSQLIEPIFTHTETVVPFCVFLDFNFIVHFINIWSVQEAVQTAVQAIDFIKSIPNGIPSSVAHLNIKFSFRGSQHHNITDAASDIRSIYRFQWIRSISGSVSAIQNSSRIWKSVNITGILLSLKISDFFDLIISSHP